MTSVKMLKTGVYWMLVIGGVLLIDHLQVGFVSSVLAVWTDLTR